MFYYPNVLQRHTGRFATIWLAATGGTKLVKREYLKVNVPQTCEEILSYILVQAPPPTPSAPRPRFSLYLSAQLQYGVVRVYSRQCHYLIEEIQHTLERLSRAQQQIRIDMGDLEQPGLLLPDNLLLMEVLEDAPDPFFGVMEPPLPSPTDIPQVPPVLPLPSPTDIPQVPPRAPPCSAYPAPLTSHRFDVFWRLPPPQRDQPHPPGAGGQGERDLPEITAREIDLLAEQEDFVLPPASPRTPPRRRPMEGGGPQGSWGAGEGGQGAHPATPAPSHASFSPPELEEEMRAREAEITARLSPPTRVGEEPPAEVETPILPEELARLPKEELPPPPELSPPREPGLPPPPPSPAVTPRVTRPPSSPKLELAVYEPAPPRTPRRQLRFLDEVTQIPRDQFKKQILDVRAQCRPLVVVEVPARQRQTPAELLRAPTYGWLPPELLALWQRCAILQPVDYAALWAEEERKEEPISELEVAREALEPSIPVMVSSEISLETTEEEVPRPSLVTPEERRLVPEPEEALPIVPELPEVSLELPPDRDLITLEYIRRLVAAELEQVGETDFRSLVPTTTSRSIASRIFYLCLVLCGLQFLQLDQAEPYGPILLKRGARFRSG
ncbi:LOW QUALITY PROTEIN: meiotic recombination protein REC8 homolog [Malaclemys terrapin pileata]|uniref:LOW QUALITY PROTEIN: meiotic recombination protein REC8 homolog n=1 Tax=Malaclemys terrapin pileata TaxID=2991368 RepID=UPI0023A8659E|nr:LOW QUALITY PROTEIN: meiotic recombination protein REC8 homolog [Malaclemys terrapin pileata]